jgi:glycerol-3-phosphate responsive antiterminator
MKTIIECLRDSPIIAAVNSEEGLEAALACDCEVVFLLLGSVVTIASQVERVKDSGKRALVHIDLIDGFSSREVVIDALRALCAPDGVISTKPPLLRRAHQLGFTTVQRVFAIDSKSVANLKNLSETGKPDFIEIMPGLIPRVLRSARELTGIPEIAGGLIEEKAEVIAALDAGAVAVSTTHQGVWSM